MVAEPIPTTLPLRPPSMLMAKAQAYVTPETNQKQMRQALKEHEEEYEEQLKSDLQRGLGPFVKLPAEVRRALFRRVTQMPDVPFLLMEPDFLIEAVTLGQIKFASVYWAEVFTLRNYLKKEFLKLFRRDFLHMQEQLRAQFGVSV